jgi:hypothetical protein
VTFAVMAERCDQCLFGPDKIVSNERRAEILRGIRAEDGHFICHKASIAGVVAACRGDWDRNGCGQLGRIMGRLGAVRFVAEDELPSLPPDRSRDEEVEP